MGRAFLHPGFSPCDAQHEGCATSPGRAGRRAPGASPGREHQDLRLLPEGWGAGDKAPLGKPGGAGTGGAAAEAAGAERGAVGEQRGQGRVASPRGGPVCGKERAVMSVSSLAMPLIWGQLGCGEGNDQREKDHLGRG